MTKEREALKLALEYIETNAHERRHVRWAIKEALAQPEQEPVAEIVSDVNGYLSTQWRVGWIPNEGDKLYTAPPAAQPEERNFCPRCGKRTADPTTIHTCTPPQENT